MTSISEIVGQFRLFNVEVGDEVASKCLEICLTYNVDAEELVDQWFAYTSSVLRGAAPTLDYLEKMERQEFLKSNEAAFKVKTAALKEPSLYVSSTLSPNTDFLGTPKENHTPKSRIRSPIHNGKLLDGMIASTSSLGIPSDISGIDSLSAKCNNEPEEVQFKTEPNINLVIKPVCEDSLKPDQRYMYEVLGKRRRCLNNMTEYLAAAISKKYKLQEDKNNDNGTEVSLFFGRILSDSDGKINNQSVLLEEIQKNSHRTVYLNLSKLSKYSLFPGQSVAVRGNYEKTSGNNKDKIFVEEIYADTNLDMFSEPLPISNGSLQLMIASGPFTTQENLLFEPLNDLLRYAKEYKPNVLLLMGPFYETNHPGILNGELQQNFELFFFSIMDNIMKTLENTNIHVIVVSSQKEPHHFPAYPTLPYEVREKYENLTFLPDPAMVNVNGLIIGATTADVLFDISNFEICRETSNSPSLDRIGRIASNLLKQQSFYPLHPPYKDMYVDMSLMESHGIMTDKPHVLLLPSNLRYFVKEIDNSLIINPGRISKGNNGTFARIELSSKLRATICDRSTCKILKI